MYIYMYTRMYRFRNNNNYICARIVFPTTMDFRPKNKLYTYNSVEYATREQLNTKKKS